MSMLWHPDHIADLVLQEGTGSVVRMTRPCTNHSVWDLNYARYPGILERLDRAGFGLVFKMYKIQSVNEVLEALLERWRPERNCFDLPSGEKTITLEDVAYITGLPIDGAAVTNSFSSLPVFDYCNAYLPSSPPNSKPVVVGYTVHLPWLKQSLEDYLSEHPSEDMMDRYARGLILLMIAGVLMPMPSNDAVHLMYLPLLVDLDGARNYSWGAATLGWLYRALYLSASREKPIFCGCTHLLFVWFWLRWPSLAPIPREVVPEQYMFPLAARFGRVQLYHHTYKRSVPWIRAEIEKRDPREFVWQPYIALDVSTKFSRKAYDLGRARIPLVCFYAVEFQYPDRVLRQFGIRQGRPSVEKTEVVDKLRRTSMQGKTDKDWDRVHATHIAAWNQRDHCKVVGHVIQDNRLWRPSFGYKEWFAGIGLPYFWPDLDYPPVHEEPRLRIPGQRKTKLDHVMRNRLQIEQGWRNEPLLDYTSDDVPDPDVTDRAGPSQTASDDPGVVGTSSLIRTECVRAQDQLLRMRNADEDGSTDSSFMLPSPVPQDFDEAFNKLKKHCARLNEATSSAGFRRDAPNQPGREP